MLRWYSRGGLRPEKRLNGARFPQGVLDPRDEGFYPFGCTRVKRRARRDGLTGEARERVLDWWASAIDREAKPRPDIERQGVYQRIRTRMDEELATHPGSGAAAYWIAAAARAQGDLQAAWDAAQAGWVRARLGSDKGAALRSDLDRLEIGRAHV